MVQKVNLEEALRLLNSVKEFSLTVGEECPEGHRREPSSGRCLPNGSTDHTAFTRSVNDDQGDLWRGLKDKNAPTFDDDRVADRASENKEAALMDAFEMDEPISCSEGSTFSFVQRKCVSMAEAEQEDAGEVAGHSEIIALDPEGRKDTVNFECPTNQLFDHKLRKCIPLNKDTVMASLDGLGEEEKARYLSGKLGVTSPDPRDGHYHLVTLDEEGNGTTSLSRGYGLEDGHGYSHSHKVAAYVVENYSSDDYSSLHFGHVIPREMWEYEGDGPAVAHVSGEEGKELETKTRNALPDSSFGVPAKRKFPLHDCSHVRNAMSRFNQAKGLSIEEKATLRRKIVSKAKGCGIEIKNFAKATTNEEFEQIKLEMLMTEDRVRQDYSADEKKPAGPCPPFLTWDPKAKKCSKAKGFFEQVLKKGSHQEIIALDPEGRKDTVNFECPTNQIFDHKLRKCIPLNKDTVMASEEDAAGRQLSPSPKGRPARLPQDCPKGTIWDGDLEDCKPLDSRKKTKSEEEAAKAPSGPGKDKDSKGCAPGEFFNPFFKKCVKGKPNFFKPFKKKGSEEQAGSEGLTSDPAGKVKLPYDCPAGTIWDGNRRTCTPLDPADKNRPSGDAGPYNPKDLANFVNQMSTAQLIQVLDDIIRAEAVDNSGMEVAKVAAKDLPNEAFPPSLVRASQRALLHHNPDVDDPYDNASVNIARLRNALARVDRLTDYSEHALEEARSHLVYHAREIVKAYLGKD